MRAALGPGTPASAPAGVTGVLVIALATLLAIRVLGLKYNATDLFFDEAQYWSWSLEPAFGYYSKPPLIAWLISGASSVCGASEFCIRLPAPLLHTVTSYLVFLIGCRLYGSAAGLWSALAFATLPGISVSAGIISTDVPLLLFWALALWGLAELMHGKQWWPVLPLAAGIGLGLNAKYAMVFFLGCLLVYVLITPSERAVLRDRRLQVGIALGLLLIVPNLGWNFANGFATFAHTADNAKWEGSLFHPGKGLEFVAAQLGVFGPILFVALIWLAWRGWRQGLAEPDRLLMCFTLPVIAIITAQAFVSRAHANWAATAYVAGTVLVSGVLLRQGQTRWLAASLVLQAVLAPVLAIAPSRAAQLYLPGIGNPFSRMLGWSGMAADVRATVLEAQKAGRPFQAVITDDRSITAELLYYMRGVSTPVLAWRDGGRPHDHYELTRPYAAGLEPVLLVSVRRDASRIIGRFATVVPLGERRAAIGAHEARTFNLYALSGQRGQ